MVGYTVSGLENEISYVQKDWPLVVLKELDDNAYDFLKEFYPYPASPKEHRRIAYNIWQPYPDNPNSAEYSIIRIAATSSNIDNLNVFEDLQLIFDFDSYGSSKRYQYKGGTGELGDALKRMLKMGYASWISLNQRKQNLQWEQPMILTFNKKRYNILLNVDTEIEKPKAIITPVVDAIINNADTIVSVALPLPSNCDYNTQVDRLKQYYNLYKTSKIQTSFSLTE